MVGPIDLASSVVPIRRYVSPVRSALDRRVVGPGSSVLRQGVQEDVGTPYMQEGTERPSVAVRLPLVGVTVHGPLLGACWEPILSVQNSALPRPACGDTLEGACG